MVRFVPWSFQLRSDGRPTMGAQMSFAELQRVGKKK